VETERKAIVKKVEGSIPLFEVLIAMRTYGGSFAQQLAMCIQVADEDNQRRLIRAFPEIMDHYAELVRLQKKQL
jgi:hypothetical protein